MKNIYIHSPKNAYRLQNNNYLCLAKMVHIRARLEHLRSWNSQLNENNH